MSAKGNDNGTKKSEAAAKTNGIHPLATAYHQYGDKRDGILDVIKTEMQIEANGHVGGRIPKQFLDKVSLDSGVGATTLRAWLYGDTKRPRHLSTRFVLEALGVTTKRFRRDGTEIKSNW